MKMNLPHRLYLGLATGVLALALAGLPVTVQHGSIDGKAAMADAGGKGKANGNAKGHSKGTADDMDVANAGPGKAKGKVTKDDAMHPSNLGRLNGYLNASPQALANAAPNSAIGKLSQEYRDALLDYSTTGNVTTDELAEILAEAANKQLTAEQVIAVHEKLMATNPELAEEAIAAQLTDEGFAEQLAEEANEIQAAETNQGLGNDDDDDIAEGDDGDDGDDGESQGALADAADAVGDAAVSTADAIGDFFDETF